MGSLRRTFNDLNSYKHLGRDNEAEEAPILLNDHEYPWSDLYRHPGVERDVVVVNIDPNAAGDRSTTASNGIGANNKANIWRESSYDSGNDPTLVNVDGGGGSSSSNGNSMMGTSAFAFRPSEDPPTKLIGQFLHKQRASGDASLDVDLKMVELAEGAIREDRSSRNPPTAPSPPQISKDLKVSFGSSPRVPNGKNIPQRTSKRRGSDTSEGEDEEDHVSTGGDRDQTMLCRSSRPLPAVRNSTLLRTKTKSRLMDPPRMMKQKSNTLNQSCVQEVRKSRLLKSGMVGKVDPVVADHDEEYDPFFDEDLPDDFKKRNVGVLTVLEWLCFVLIVGAFICSLTVSLSAKQVFWGLHMWKWALLLLVLFCGQLVSGWAIRLVVFFIERNFTLRKRLLYFVYGVRRAVQNSLWLGLVLISWRFMFDSKLERETKSQVLPYVTKVLVCLLTGTLIWLVKTLCVKSLASSFHVSVYFDRIQDSLFNQYVIQTLSGPPFKETERQNQEEERLMAEMKKLEKAGAKIPMDLRAAAAGGRTDSPPTRSGPLEKCPRIGKSCRPSGARTSAQEEGITIDHLHRLNQRNVSAWNMKRLMKIVRYGALSTTLDESVQQIGQEDEQTMQIQSEYQAKAAARKIFQNVAKPGSKCITLMDLMRFMNEEEAIKTMSLFEEGKDADRVSRSALKTWAVNAFIERRALALTLNDTKTAVNKLHQMVNVVVGIVIAVLWLLILGIATTHLLVVVSSQVLLVSFMFGNTCKTIFESVMFLFAMHPYDVGDRCEVDGVEMVVEEMNILTTVFLRLDNLKITYPNSVLSTKPISNYYRSPDMGDRIVFCIHISTPDEKIAILKERIKL